jgi:hypothetical protein
MNNFGVIELASAKTTSAPGWAYVPDNTITRPTAPTNRKRARNVPGLTYSDLTARQDHKIRKEAEALDKDGGKDNTIPLPVKNGRSMRQTSALCERREIDFWQRKQNTHLMFVRFSNRRRHSETTWTISSRCRHLQRPTLRILGPLPLAQTTNGHRMVEEILPHLPNHHKKKS